MTFPERVIELNRWYDSLPEPRRILVYPAVLLAAGAINMHWTGSPFGLVFLLTLAMLFALRRSYTAGWVKAEAATGGPAGALEHQPKIEPPAFKAPVVAEKPAAPAAQPAPQPAPQPASQAVPQAAPQAAPVPPPAAAAPVVRPAAAAPAPVAPPAPAPAPAPAAQPAAVQAKTPEPAVAPAKAPVQASPADAASRSQQGKRGKPQGKPGKGNGPKSR
jgi:outer membrane biosynthesis protein TonB